MSKITYRNIAERDYEEVKSMINQSFSLYKVIPNPNVLKKVLAFYLHSCLAESTYSLVAEKGGKVIGVILGQADNDGTHWSNIRHLLAMMYQYMMMTLMSIKDKTGVNDYKKVLNAYNQLIKGRKQDYDGTITLFIVTEESRGLGIGKTLVSLLIDYMKQQGVQHFYLFTDSNCNYGFYDHMGFVRQGETKISIDAMDMADTLDIYLYGYEI
ncbi:GNAT family N-acetyltransferase [Paenibacillus marinisediminis]